jgi:hypothetical protein
VGMEVGWERRGVCWMAGGQRGRRWHMREGQASSEPAILARGARTRSQSNRRRSEGERWGRGRGWKDKCTEVCWVRRRARTGGRTEGGDTCERAKVGEAKRGRLRSWLRVGHQRHLPSCSNTGAWRLRGLRAGVHRGW